MTTTETGRKAEQAAVVYLEMRGFTVLEQNFRRPRCEIDIIASKDNTVHFVEVKYRKNDDQGGGLDAITNAKLRQMRLASQIWSQESKWHGDIVLSAIEVSGPTFIIMGFIENIF